MFAVIRTGGKQYKVRSKDRIRVEKLAGDPGAEVSFDVLLLGGEKPVVGKPVVSGAVVKGKIVGHVDSEKTTMFKKRRRKDWKRKVGHRQPLTVVEILDVRSE
jgi:large subunit ribosomal protein L21